MQLLRTLFFLAIPLLVAASFADQEVLSPPVMGDGPSKHPGYTPVTTTKPTLTDLLTIESSASIYFSYARDTSFSNDFSVADTQWTLLVPTNKAVMALSRKPHQGTAPEPEIKMTEQEYDEESRRNVERWVAAHIIPSCVLLSEVPVTYDTLLDGKSITFAPVSSYKKGSPEWSGVTVEDGVHIVGMKEGENGVIYMIDGTVNPDH